MLPNKEFQMSKIQESETRLHNEVRYDYMADIKTSDQSLQT